LAFFFWKVSSLCNTQITNVLVGAALYLTVPSNLFVVLYCPLLLHTFARALMETVQSHVIL